MNTPSHVHNHKKIGIMGGTFDPIHNGHLHIAKAALEQYGLDEVWFVVAGIPPHKRNEGGSNDFLNGYTRAKLVELAIKEEPRFILRTDELQRPGSSYSYQTMQYFKKRYPDYAFYFIMGEDSLIHFKEWKHPEILSKYTSFLVAVRSDASDSDPATMQALADEMENTYQTSFNLLNASFLDISSTDIRNAFKAAYDEAGTGLITDLPASMGHQLPETIANYIAAHHLYDTYEVEDALLKKIRADLEETLDKKRFIHSLGVADTAFSLAAAHHYPVKIAYLAGLLHDCAKNLSDEAYLTYCQNNGLTVSSYEERSPKLLHALVGSHMAKDVYAIRHADILEAIRTHTTGEADMSLLQKIIYVADYIEPNRTRSKILSEARQTAYFDIDLAVSVIAEETLSFLKEKNVEIDQKTMETFNFYSKETIDEQ